jgi:hypothetical protein
MDQIKTLEEQMIRFEQKQNDWLGSMKKWINEAQRMRLKSQGITLCLPKRNYF